MITLITGVPGAGKTLNTIKRVVNEAGDRAVYYRGIRGLTLPWNEISDQQAADWQSLPDGSVVVIDEVQDIFPPRSPNKSEPPGVKALDKHRHRGFDFYFITQKPKGFDHSVRGYCGRHFHYERAFNRNSTRELEWQKAVDDPQDYHTRKDAQTTRVNFDKKYFDVYKSSEIHTHKPRMPKAAYIAVAALFSVAVLAAFGYSSIMDRIDPDENMAEIYKNGSDSDGLLQNIGNPTRRNSPLSADEYLQSWSPRIKNVPYSAPAYDKLTVVKTFPRPQCILHIRKSQCRCYSQQATPLDIDPSTCNSIVRSGWFNPFLEEGTDGARGVEGRRDAPQPPAPSLDASSTVLETPIS